MLKIYSVYQIGVYLPLFPAVGGTWVYCFQPVDTFVNLRLQILA